MQKIINRWILVFSSCHKWFQTAVLWPLREGVYPQGPGQRRNCPYAVHATRIRCSLRAFLHGLSSLKENRYPRNFYFASSYTINLMNTGKDLLVWVGLVNSGLIFIPSPIKMILITPINQCCYLCMCWHNQQDENTLLWKKLAEL